MAGDDILVLETDPIVTVDVMGMTDGILQSMPIIQCVAIIDTVDEGKILIMSQYAQWSNGKTFHFKNQLEHFGCKVLDTAQCHGSVKSSTPQKAMLFPTMPTMVSSTSTCPFLMRITLSITRTHSSPLTPNGTLPL